MPTYISAVSVYGGSYARKDSCACVAVLVCGGTMVCGGAHVMYWVGEAWLGQTLHGH